MVRLARPRRTLTLAGCDGEHRLREPVPYHAPSPLGDVHMLAPPVRFSSTAPAWPHRLCPQRLKPR